MTRSYHITKKAAMKRFAKGDTETAVEYSEKKDIKNAQRKYGKVYSVIHPSDKTPALRNSVTVAAVKGVKKSIVHDYRRKQ